MTNLATTYEPSTFQEPSDDMPAEIRYVAYDDAWLRDAIGVIRSDVREMRGELRDHIKDDAGQWKELHECVDNVGDQVKAVQEKLVERHRIIIAGAGFAKWFIALLCGGGLATLFKLTGKAPW